MDSQNWHPAIDTNLVRRLMRPVDRPGAIAPNIGNAIIARIERMTNHLPLLVQFAQRRAGMFQPDQIPIVYAQPANSVQVFNTYPAPVAGLSTTSIQGNVEINLFSTTAVTNSTTDPTEPSLIFQNVPLVSAPVSSDNSPQVPILLNQPFRPEQSKTAASETALPNLMPQISSVKVNSVQAKSTALPAPFSIQEQIKWRLVPPETPKEPIRQASEEVNGRWQSLPKASRSLRKESPQAAPGSPLPVVSVSSGADGLSPMVGIKSPSLLNEHALNKRSSSTPLIFTQATAIPPPTQPTASIPTYSPLVPPLDRREPPRSRPFSSSFTETNISDIPQAPVNIEALTNQVERKLMRRLVIESERRGQNRWR
jgi:hypothetical protein